MTATPLSAPELCEAIRNRRVIDLSRLDRVLGVDAERGLIEAQARTAWQTIARALRPGDARAAGLRTTMNTVGESIDANFAGPDGRPAVDHVAALSLITPLGELRRVSRNRDAELFSLIAGGQGLFGTVYSISLRIGTLGRAVQEATQPSKLALQPESASGRTLVLLLPPHAVDGFISETDARCSDWRIPLESVETRRTFAEEDSYLRWACTDYEEVKLRLPAASSLGAAVRRQQLAQDLIDAAIAAGGRFHIACTTEATREQTDACYPQLGRFLEQKRRFDPDERCVNPWYLRQKNLLAGKACDVRWAS